MRHRCGGELQPQLVKIQKKIGYYKQTFTVEGYKCDNCDEVVISGDMAFEIDRTIVRLRELWRNWNIPFNTTVTGSFAREQVLEKNTYVKQVL